jgi:hypothetical protein
VRGLSDRNWSGNPEKKPLAQICKLASYSAEYRRKRRKQKENKSSHPANPTMAALPLFRHKPR